MNGDAEGFLDDLLTRSKELAKLELTQGPHGDAARLKRMEVQSARERFERSLADDLCEDVDAVCSGFCHNQDETIARMNRNIDDAVSQSVDLVEKLKSFSEKKMEPDDWAELIGDADDARSAIAFAKEPQ